LYKFEVLFIPLLGDHQLLNASTAVGAVEALSFHEIEIPETAIEEGLRMVNWPGRMEVVQRNPTVILDCAKDVEAAKAVKETLLDEFTFNRLIAVVSISSDKNIQAMIEQFAQVTDFFVLTSHSVMGRAADPTLLSEEVERHNKSYDVVPDVKEAVRRAIELAEEDDFVIVVGSVFLVGEAREIWFKPSQLEL
jgi:dihydrofolate synthase/folylpolyglutamate synthase